MGTFNMDNLDYMAVAMLILGLCAAIRWWKYTVSYILLSAFVIGSFVHGLWGAWFTIIFWIVIVYGFYCVFHSVLRKVKLI